MNRKELIERLKRKVRSVNSDMTEEHLNSLNLISLYRNIHPEDRKRLMKDVNEHLNPEEIRNLSPSEKFLFMKNDVYATELYQIDRIHDNELDDLG